MGGFVNGLHLTSLLWKYPHNKAKNERIDFLNATEIFRAVMVPLGVQPRTFLVDYRDEDDNYFHTESALVGEANDSFIISEIIKEYASKNFVAYGIVEILNGYSSGEVAAMAPREAVKHIRPIYFDAQKEKAPTCQ